jgi:hypothetical protein
VPAPPEETALRHVRSSRLPGPIEQILNSALSRGPGYEPVPAGTAFDDSSVRGYYIDYSAKTTARAFADPARLGAVDLVQLGLGWYERELAGDPAARSAFLDVCALVEERADPAGDELRWWIRYPVPKYRVAAPWCSALSQGQAASLFVRAHLATGDDRYADLARRAAAPLRSEGGSDLVTHTGAGPILQEYPSDPPSHVLNGWISASWGLWDVHLGLGDARSGASLDATLACLRTNLDAYDTGWWTRYSLYPLALQDLAKPIYQAFHVAQLRVLHQLTGDAHLLEVAERWAGYDRAAARVLALAQKGLFAAVDLPRRRRWRPDAAA